MFQLSENIDINKHPTSPKNKKQLINLCILYLSIY